MDHHKELSRIRQEKDLTEYKQMIASQKLKPCTMPIQSDPRDLKLLVAVRKRPLLSKEKGEIDCISVSNPRVRVNECGLKVDLRKVVTNHDFKFDYSFSEEESTDSLYSQVIKPLIPLLHDKGTITIFAYGPTGSGKTFTMEGIQGSAIEDMFSLEQPGDNLKYYASYFEIYDGKVYDLLNKRQQLVLLEDGKNKIQVKGLSKTETNSAERIMNVIQFGNSMRSTSPTIANDTSSRSHAICKVQIKKDENVIGTLLLIDLAGSEKAQLGQANNRKRRLEGTEINKSLLALKECIRAIDMKGPHIPFRASKLTMVLRDSFIGSSKKNKIVMIACISPGKNATSDTINTLLYADRLKENKQNKSNAPGIVLEPVSLNKIGPKIVMTKDEKSKEERDLKMLMNTLMMEDKDSFLLLNAAEELKKAEEELIEAHGDYIHQNEVIKMQQRALGEKLKDLEVNDIESCITEMEKIMAKQAELQKNLKEKIAAYKKKQSEEEELSKQANK